MDSERANALLRQVETDYDTIADAFAGSRMYQWYEVTHIVDQYVRPGMNVLDLGCGNGRLAELINKSKARYLGMDVSSELIALAQHQYPQNQFRVSSIMNIDAPDDTFDLVFLIASFHHIPSQHYRIQALEEITRVTAPGGRIIMLNWNRHQWRYSANRWMWNLKKMLRMNDMDKNDVLVPWKDNKGNVLAERYYHSFTVREMQRLAQAASLTIVDQYYEKQGMHVSSHIGQNLVTVLQKTE